MHHTRSTELSAQETIELPLTETTQQALHEAAGHLYDAFAVAALETDEPIPEELFDDLEALYVATAEESLSDVQIRYERTND